MMKMIMKKILLSHCGMTGEGRTVKEAKQDAARKIEEVLQGSYTPQIVSYRDEAALMWRTPTAWTYAFVRELSEISGCHILGYGMKDACDRAMRRHLAQNTWRYEDGTTVPAIVTDEQDRKELEGYFNWQLRYRKAASQGFDDETARRYAGGLEELIEGEKQ